MALSRSLFEDRDQTRWKSCCIAAKDANTTLSPGPPSRTSRPPPPIRMSSPGPPRSVSLPALPRRTSAPSPPSKVRCRAMLPSPKAVITSSPTQPRDVDGVVDVEVLHHHGRGEAHDHQGTVS